jgi:hypothetical protein
MKRNQHLTHEFVEFIPDHHQLQDGIVYVSIQYATAVHKCCCGCGEEVVTPLSPTSWQMTFDGRPFLFTHPLVIGTFPVDPITGSGKTVSNGTEVVSKRDQFAKNI